MITSQSESGRITADIVLIHPPAYYDFRKEDQVYFPYFSTSGDIPITPLYDTMPMGFKSLQNYLSERGYDVKILNVSSLLLQYPEVDFEGLMGLIDAKVIGISLHWMVHVQGSLAIGELLHRLHPDTPVLYGGITSSYYFGELIQYPYVDLVMRGYDTHEPMALLLEQVLHGQAYEKVPNLVWKDRQGGVQNNGVSYTPGILQAGIDWSAMPKEPKKSLFPIKDIVTVENVGCTHDCGWCGGSRAAFRRINHTSFSLVQKDMDIFASELDSLKNSALKDTYNMYSCGTYNQTEGRLLSLLRHVGESNLKSVIFDQFHLTTDQVTKYMAMVSDNVVINLSPQSHDQYISKLSGRGTFSMPEMEAWIEKALAYGIKEIDIWFFIGMPHQDAASVFETVEYCGRLMKRFQGQRVIPYICPMLPLLDPGSNFFVNPGRYGYQVLKRTLEEHRIGMGQASLISRMNYQTDWMGSKEIVNVGYQSIARLFEAKGGYGLLPEKVIAPIVNKLRDACERTNQIYDIEQRCGGAARKTEIEKLSDDILNWNQETFFSGVANQAFPINRKIGGRWYDEILWDRQYLDEISHKQI